jgi:nucleoside-diphosphate-sugar epimerase
MRSVKGIARRVVALSSGDVYRAYGVLRRTETGPPELAPIAEDAPLRQRLYPYRGETPRAPDDPMRWADDYDKIKVEHAVMGEEDLPGTVLRLPMTYGPGDLYHRLFAYLKRMDDRRPVIILDEVHGRWRWARGYVENVAEAVVLAVVDDRASGRIYNLSEPDALTELEWVEAIGDSVGWNGRVVTLPCDRLPPRLRQPLNFEQHLTYDTSRIREELGYTEGIARDEAISRTVDWERSHPPEIVDSRDFDYAAEDAALAGLSNQ